MLNRKKIYNPESNESVNDRKIFGGNPTSIFELNKIKYQWAYQLWKTMLANTWFPEEVNMNQDKKDYTHKLTPEEKTGYDRALAQLIFMDSLQANNLIDNVNPFITSPEINLILVRQAFEECLIEGTEVLTSEGFKDFRDLKETDLVANYNEDGGVFFNYPKAIIKKEHDGDMFRFYQTNYEQIVTPNHRVVKKYPKYLSRANYNKQSNIVIEEAWYCSLHNYDVPIAGYHNAGQNMAFTALDALAVAWQADGCLVNNKNIPTDNGYCYQYSFKRKDKIERIQFLINISGCKYTRTYTKDGYSHFYIWIDRRFDKNFDWVSLHDKHTLWFINFLTELKYWDGTDRDTKINRESVLFTNTNMKALNKIQSIAALAGTQSGVWYVDPTQKNKPVSNNKVPFYQSHLVLGKDCKSGREIKKEIFHYSGNVYCCSVDSGMIICRYNNNVFVTGNCLHSHSYAVMVESISANTDIIYELWRKDMMLKSKNDYIANVYEQLSKDPSDEALIKAFYANQILEGIYFYSGFSYFYTLARAGKMLGSSQMIRFIQRDEITHLNLFQNLINSVKKERPELFTNSLIEEVVEMFRKAVEIETSWGEYITQGSILGLTDDIINNYIKYLADQRMKKVGLPTLYNVDHPMKWVEQFSNLNNHKTNFFEAKVTNYAKGSLNLDDF